MDLLRSTLFQIGATAGLCLYVAGNTGQLGETELFLRDRESKLRNYKLKTEFSDITQSGGNLLPHHVTYRKKYYKDGKLINEKKVSKYYIRPCKINHLEDICHKS